MTNKNGFNQTHSLLQGGSPLQALINKKTTAVLSHFFINAKRAWIWWLIILVGWLAASATTHFQPFGEYKFIYNTAAAGVQPTAAQTMLSVRKAGLTWHQSFYYNAMVISTVGAADIVPASRCARAVTLFDASVGILALGVLLACLATSVEESADNGGEQGGAGNKSGINANTPPDTSGSNGVRVGAHPDNDPCKEQLEHLYGQVNPILDNLHSSTQNLAIRQQLVQRELEEHIKLIYRLQSTLEAKQLDAALKDDERQAHADIGSL